MKLKNLTTGTGVLLSLAIGCGSQSKNQKSQKDVSDVKIVGGFQPTPDNDFGRSLSGTVAITHTEGYQVGRSFCTGTVVGTHTIMTAAHCFTNETGGPLNIPTYVYFGQDMQKQRSKSLLRKVKTVIRHEGYNHRLTISKQRLFQKSHDIAIISFEGSLPATHSPVPVLPEEESLTQTAYLSGFGTTGTLTGNGAETRGDTGVLRAVHVRVAREHTDGGVFYVEGKDELGLPHGACPGDSGGPTYVQKAGKWYVAGALSTGHTGVVDVNRNGYLDPEDKGCKGENYYTDARVYAKWIRDQQIALGETFDKGSSTAKPKPIQPQVTTSTPEFRISSKEASQAVYNDSQAIPLRIQAERAVQDCTFTLTMVREVRSWGSTRNVETNHVSQALAFEKGQVRSVSFPNKDEGFGKVTSANITGVCAGVKAEINVL